MKFSECTKNEQWIIKTMQKLGFGEIRDLLVKGGQPQFKPEPELWRTEKFGVNTIVQNEKTENFELHKQHAFFLRYLKELGAGTLPVIQIHDGLPLVHKRRVFWA